MCAHGMRCATVQQLAMRIAAPHRHSSSKACTTVTIIFIGDSVSMRTFSAAACSLQHDGGVEVDKLRSRQQGAAYRFIHNHPAFGYLRAHGARTASDRATSYREMELINERHFAFASNLTVRLVGIWQAGGWKHGVGLMGDASTQEQSTALFRDLLVSFGSK